MMILNKRRAAASSARRSRAARFMLLCLLPAVGLFARGSSGDEPTEAFTAGRQLFHHAFVAQDALSPQGDGLGPVHNDVSCVACHRQGGVGGAGPREKNIDIVVRVPFTAKSAKESSQLLERAGKLHPQFAQSSQSAGSIMLHRSATTAGYDAYRLKMLGLKVPKNADLETVLKLEEALEERTRRGKSSNEYKVHGVSLERVQRSTPALFGAGLIDAIPDEAIRAAALASAPRRFGVQGRVAVSNPESPEPLGNPQAIGNQRRTRVGRFGWRGQTATLRQFVLNACANELGLEVPNQHQAVHPEAADYRAPGLDLSAEQCAQLIAFVAQLPRPQQIVPKDPSQRRDVERGETVFGSVGCAACHVRQLGQVDGLFSDLLLHDLGEPLGDPVGANAETFPQIPGFDSDFLSQLASFYTGGAVTTSPGLQQQWRTTPLWGVRDSAPYLHDGRAKTLDEAIVLHGGEARTVVQNYKALSGEDRRKLLAFLDTLAAPESAR